MAPRRRTRSRTLTIQVLTEAAYRCAVPTCRGILALDIHHLVPVSEDGPDELNNLIALCPTCHALFHRGDIVRESLYAWKAILVSLTHAFDFTAIDDLLFLRIAEFDRHSVSGDGVLRLSRLIVSGLVFYRSIATMQGNHGLYSVQLTDKGKQLVDAWKSGNRRDVETVLGSPAIG